ncbi:unnamed protein product [Pleuronectes platessa]|uniref:Uncharacterized protein n=1 Tax=Pleuronectes platessa TaxID=8262 RepID=A0A9N7YTM9_PLEPL|nr:unnamed protein product [Pleuronectes platessa]
MKDQESSASPLTWNQDQEQGLASASILRCQPVTLIPEQQRRQPGTPRLDVNAGVSQRVVLRIYVALGNEDFGPEILGRLMSLSHAASTGIQSINPGATRPVEWPAGSETLVAAVGSSKGQAGANVQVHGVWDGMR